MDSPGTMENEILTHVAKANVQQASIIFYVMNSVSGLSGNIF